jgi:peptide/nickel transport system permease protein
MSEILRPPDSTASSPAPTASPATAAVPFAFSRPAWHQSYWTRQFLTFAADPLGLTGLLILIGFLGLAVVGPGLAPYDPIEIQYLPTGEIARTQPPSGTYWFGTTATGRDVFSQTVTGARVAVLVGFLSAVATVFIGSNVGLLAGYYGGRFDDVLMRIVDITYGVPFLPFAIILVSLLGPSVWNIILVISLLFWRTTARVVRSQVLSLRQRPFVWSARAAGASHLHIIYRHVMPNVLPLILLYAALEVGSSVLTEAGLSFLGFGDPTLPSWGTVLRDAFKGGAIRSAWWWLVPPGVSISLFVVATYMVGRSLEFIADPRLRRGE